MKKSNQFRIFIDKVSGWMLLVLVIGITLFFALLYYLISLYFPENGIITQGDKINFWHALYYSIITETTLGYGDIYPVGFSRILCCLQVICGLILAGMAIAKISSLPGKQMRIFKYKACGFWLEPFRTEDNKTLFTYTQIYYDGSQLRYKGDNYDKDGKYNDSFRANFIAYDTHLLKFEYHNPIKNNLFTSGMMELNFSCENNKKQWTRHNSVSYDYMKGEKTIFRGWRANEQEELFFNHGMVEERSKIIQKYIKIFDEEFDKESLNNTQQAE